MVGRSFYGALDVKIIERLVPEARILCWADSSKALDVKIMDRLVRETRIQWWADPSMEHWMSI